MRRLLDVGTLLVQLGYFAVVNGKVFPLVMVVVLLLVTALSILGQAAAPFIYTLF